MGTIVQELVRNLHCDEWDGNHHAMDIQITFGIP
jgi:hypothetical protein